MILQEKGDAWAAWEGRAGGPLLPRSPNAPEPGPAELWARSEVDAARTTPRSTSAGAEEPASVVPPAGFRTCGTTRAGGGLGWHIIRNADDVWQRIEWVRRPTTQEVLALPTDAYPLADSQGALCAWGRQRAPRAWQIFVVGTTVVVDAIPNHEHPPARCEGGRGVVVDTESGTYLYTPDAPPQRVAEAGARSSRGARDIGSGRVALIQRPGASLTARLVDGKTVELPLGADRDLVGRSLPPGTTRERILAAGDLRETFLIVERLAMPDCSTREILVRWNATTGETTLLREGDIVFSRLAWGYGGFWWLESSPRLVDISGAGLDAR